MRVKFHACDCAGTAPGFPQHETGCMSSVPVPREDDYAPVAAAAVAGGEDPWVAAIGQGDELPF